MACNKGLHGALYKDFNNVWSCLVCKETINYNELKVKRKEMKRSAAITKEISKEKSIGVWMLIKQFLKRG
jgi:hypothetical protein